MEKQKLKIAIMDNNGIETFLQMRRKGIPIEKVLRAYNHIFIPVWVWREICDSRYRKAYVHQLIRDGYPVKIIRESQYAKIVNEELTLIEIFEMAIRDYAEIKSYWHKKILGGKNAAEIDYFYNEWIQMIYDNWPLMGKMIKNSFGETRRQKKNAGEISIAFLAFILMYQKRREVEITIYSHDADCKYCIDKVFERIETKQYQFGSEKVISYKNFESILQELLREKIIDIKIAEQLIETIRVERRIIYLRRKEDNTYEHRKELVDNIRLKKMINDDDILIVW